MSGLSHFWQRFLLGAALLFGLFVGIAATVFGYSNTGTVDVGFSVWRLEGVPLWTVALVPLAVVLVVGTLYHWYNSFHHFTEHMRHRRRVHELEDEVARLRSHLDHVLEMPGAAGALPAKPEPEEEAPEFEPEPSPAIESTSEASASAASSPDEPGAANGSGKPAKKASPSRKRAVLATSASEEGVEAPTNGSNGNGAGSSEAPEA